MKHPVLRNIFLSHHVNICTVNMFLILNVFVAISFPGMRDFMGCTKEVLQEFGFHVFLKDPNLLFRALENTKSLATI